VPVLHSDVVPFFAEHDILIGAILTDNGCEFCGPDNHPHGLYLVLDEIVHRRSKVRVPRPNCSVKRFKLIQLHCGYHQQAEIIAALFTIILRLPERE